MGWRPWLHPHAATRLNLVFDGFGRRAAAPRAAVAFEEEIDPGAGPFQRSVRWRNIHLQAVQLSCGFRAFIDADPDAGLFRYDFALPVTRSAAGSVAKLFRTGLRTDVLHVGQDAVAARLAAIHRRFEGELRPLEQMSE